MPKTLLAVDDSATMRKVLEITFAGEDFRVVTADGPNSALGKLSEEPVAVVIDTSLPEGDGYALAKEVRARDNRAVILIMSSRYAPYDAGRGKDAGVDDFIDKPFDSQAMIDKVKKALVAREATKGAPAPAPVVHQPAPSPAPPIAAPPPHAPAPFAPPPRPVVQPSPARPNFSTQRTHTLSFEGSPNPPPVSPTQTQPMGAAPVPSVSRTAPSGVPVVHAPAAVPPPQAPRASEIAKPPAQPAHPQPQQPTAAPAGPSVSAQVNGQLASKLDHLGLTPAQVEAVLALSREVVERVVWEVVPQLAETMIKEEIARITKEG